jgi:hypothetical protein
MDQRRASLACIYLLQLHQITRRHFVAVERRASLACIYCCNYIKLQGGHFVAVEMYRSLSIGIGGTNTESVIAQTVLVINMYRVNVVGACAIYIVHELH